MTVEFIFTKNRLTVEFTNFSSDIEEGKTPTWDFGDGNTSTEESPTHTYEKLGRYVVTLSYGEGEGESTQLVVMVSDKVFTTLSDTVYNLIDYLLPTDIFGTITAAQKYQFISKWQLYLAPIVNHCIPLEDSNNELYFEALENQLVMEAAAYDYMVLKVNQMVQGFSTKLTESQQSSHSGSGDDDEEGKVKHITTGPSEVEFFNEEDYLSDVFANIIKAMDPKGIIALMRQQLCMLAERLDIYLPICQRQDNRPVVPRVVNRRRPGFMGGPDPIEALK